MTVTRADLAAAIALLGVHVLDIDAIAAMEFDVLDEDSQLRRAYEIVAEAMSIVDTDTRRHIVAEGALFGVRQGLFTLAHEFDIDAEPPGVWARDV